MPDYSVFLLDANGHVINGRSSDFACDDDAYAAARALLDVDGQAEIWSQGRQIGFLLGHPDSPETRSRPNQGDPAACPSAATSARS